MVPYATLLIPLYVLLNALGLQNSLVGVALVLTPVPAAVRDVHDADLVRVGAPRARRGGAWSTALARSRVLWRILLPAVKPGLITVGLFAFLAAWNDFIAPLILISDDQQVAAAAGVATCAARCRASVDYGATEAGVVVLAVPCLLLFILLQRHYVRGFMSGAVKG